MRAVLQYSRSFFCHFARLGFVNGSMAPFAMERFAFGTTSSSSTSSVLPKPLQFSQAPNGLLKEKEIAERGSDFRRHFGQWLCVVKSSPYWYLRSCSRYTAVSPRPRSIADFRASVTRVFWLTVSPA